MKLSKKFWCGYWGICIGAGLAIIVMNILKYMGVLG